MKPHIVLKLLLLSLTFPVIALSPGDKVDNFRLLDHHGDAHELYYYSDASAVVLMVHGNGCPIVRNAMPAFREIRDRYADNGVKFLMINSNLQDTRETIVTEAQEFGYDMPVLMDETQLIGESLGLDRTSEILVINPRDWTLAYRGAIDDRLTYERQKAKANAHYLDDALKQLQSGQRIKVARTEAPGCIINFTDRDRESHAGISYASEIAPILQARCVSCHQTGGIAPWAMSSYNMVLGFSPMMREVIRTQRMPPWHADPHYGEWENDRSLTPAEKKTLVHWIEAGSPRGEGIDPLAATVAIAPEWALGEPDLIIDLPAHQVPATGVVDYQYLRAQNPLDHDVWVRAAELVPGDRQAVHHVITRFTAAGTDQRRAFRGGATGGGFGGYVPGSSVWLMPEDAGVLLPAKSNFVFQMHYTPYGKATTDESRLGIYFYDKPPTHRMAGTVLINVQLKIPPNAPAHSETTQYTFPQAAEIYGMLPHAHYRGKAARYTAYYPDGTNEVLLSVPAYDFNWQTFYKMAQPRRVPAGTRVTFTMTWDNSAQNPANPDPDREVRWGRQSWQEMQFGTLSFRFLAPGETVERATAAR